MTDVTVNDVEVIYYSATWCRPCKVFGPLVERVVPEYPVKLTKIVVDEAGDDGMRMALKHHINNVPTLVRVKDGQTMKMVGANNEESVRAFLEM